MKNLKLSPGICMTMILTLAFLFSGQAHAQTKEETTPPQTIEELKTAIEKVLKETETPAVGVALVNKEGPVWIAGLGKANVEKDVDANENTMFRIGSVSKMYVALAVLKLQEEGRLSLQDKVRDLAPEIEFTNRWEDTNPILVEHLLEHTTGWSDLHLTEFAHSDPTPVTLKEGLDFHPHSRTSRWIPGTRMAYCNSGPPVAAYIVGKITGQPFEEYVQSTFFDPMKMENMTYFASEAYKTLGASLYNNGKTVDYWHILMRPAGSINASPRDMAKMLEFFIHRGMVDSVQLISHASLKRMETTLTTTGAQAGLEIGYGLHNYSMPHKSFVYRGHDGGVDGGLTTFSYLPEHGAGHAIMINSGSRDALNRITKLVRDFQTRDFQAKEISTDSELSDGHTAISGFYRSINPRMQIFYFLERIMNVQRIWHKEDTLFRNGLPGGESIKYLPAEGHRFKSAKTGLISMVQATDPLAGEVIHAGDLVLKRISMVQAYGPLILGALWLFLMLTSILYGLVWPIRWRRGKIKGKANIRVRLWPLLANLFILAIILMMLIWGNSLKLLGTVSFVSLVVMISTIGFAMASVWSVFLIITERSAPMKRRVYWHSAILSFLHLIVAGYLLWFGVIGIRLWA